MTNQLRSPPRSSLRSPFEHRRGGAFNPASLASSAFYDRTVLSTLFQDYAGTTNITATAQPIGLELDLSQGLVLGPELVTNPGNPFSTTTGWTDNQGNAPLSMDSGVLTATPTTTAACRTETNFPTIIGRSYMLRINVQQFSGAGQTIALLQTSNGALVTGTNIYSDTGWLQVIFTAVTTTTYLTIGSNISTIGVPTQIVGASVRHVAGNHAIQSTAGKRPVTAGSPIYADFDGVDDDIVTTFPASLGAGCTVCRSLPGAGASITTGVTIGTTFTDNVDAHALLIFTAAQWADLSAGQISQLTAWLNKKAGL